MAKGYNRPGTTVPPQHIASEESIELLKYLEATGDKGLTRGVRLEYDKGLASCTTVQVYRYMVEEFEILVYKKPTGRFFANMACSFKDRGRGYLYTPDGSRCGVVKQAADWLLRVYRTEEA